MIFTITIEETIDKDFEVEANSIEEAFEIVQEKYRECEFVLDEGSCVTYKMIGYNGKFQEF